MLPEHILAEPRSRVSRIQHQEINKDGGQSDLRVPDPPPPPPGAHFWLEAPGPAPRFRFFPTASPASPAAASASSPPPSPLGQLARPALRPAPPNPSPLFGTAPNELRSQPLLLLPRLRRRRLAAPSWHAPPVGPDGRAPPRSLAEPPSRLRCALLLLLLQLSVAAASWHAPPVGPTSRAPPHSLVKRPNSPGARCAARCCRVRHCRAGGAGPGTRTSPLPHAGGPWRTRRCGPGWR